MEREKIPQANILDCKLNLVDMEETLRLIELLVYKGDNHHVVTLNAEIVYQATINKELQEIINKASLVTADGIGIVWAARTLGFLQKERVSGIDLMLKTCSRAAMRGWKVYLLGAAPGVAEKAAEELKQKYPGLNICGYQHGYFDRQAEKQIIAGIIAKKPQVLFAAMGAPKQEFWLSRNLERLQVPVSIGVGGSFDVIAGIKRRAPQMFIKLNLEWLYRLLSEPARFRRQLVLPAFVIAVLRQKYDFK
ncbi:MAG: WecB/TagA/CpsF family glycosyltransferase [Syntrophomonadaceae bacterium]|jgi:N-acetylglucosaminyldiphosphoundecaprenol N-acetyl-beta-D-mannosaminyltransferase